MRQAILLVVLLCASLAIAANEVVTIDGPDGWARDGNIISPQNPDQDIVDLQGVTVLGIAGGGDMNAVTYDPTGIIEDGTGRSVSSAGDFNDDGFDDIVFGRDANTGSVYILFGNNTNTPEVDLNSLNGINGIEFQSDSIHEYNLFGSAVTGLGDMDDDGFDDIAFNNLITSTHSTINIIYGSDALNTPLIKIDSLITDDRASVINTPPGIWARTFAAKTLEDDALIYGDINGDGFEDIIMGNDTETNNGQSAAGTVYVVFGTGNRLPDISLDTLNGQNGFKFVGYESAGNLG